VSARAVVAVVSWNTRELLARCLRSLEPDVRSGLAEVVVVDNGSTDGSRELVHEQFGWVRLIEPDENLGFGSAVNLAARESESEWVAASNADLEFEPGALARLIEAGESSERIGCVAPRLLLPDGSTQRSVYPFPSAAAYFAAALGLAGAKNPEQSAAVDWPVGAFVLFRRKAFEEVGGFDERQWMFAEDLDIGWRLARAGYERRYEPAAVVRHWESAATGAAFGAERTERTWAATYAWIARRRGPGRARLYAGCACTGTLLRMLFTRGRERERLRWWLRVHARGLRSGGTGAQGADAPYAAAP
jgi:N-acetylglucosaminyl-diphospho-decaprenol L-rhamnosyltransferase